MDHVAEVRVTKHRTRTTPQGCRVETTSSYDTFSGLYSENIVLSHPQDLGEVAFGASDVFSQMHWRRS